MLEEVVEQIVTFRLYLFSAWVGKDINSLDISCALPEQVQDNAMERVKKKKTRF